MCHAMISDRQVREYFLLMDRDMIVKYIKYLHASLKVYSSNPSIVPPRVMKSTPDGSTLHIYMPVIDDEYSGIKMLGFNPQSKKGFTGSINVTDSHSGDLIGIVSGKQLTGIRTALCSCIGLYFQLNQFHDSVIEITIFGSGLQAFWHAFVTSKVFDKPLRVNVIYQSCLLPTDDLELHLSNISFRQYKANNVENIEKCVRRSHVIFGCIPSVHPSIFLRYLIHPGPNHTYISLIGSYTPLMHECDSDLIAQFQNQKIKIIVDSKQYCLHDAGELIDSNIQSDELIEIGELDENTLNLNCSISLRTVTLSKIVGLAIMDICIAKHILKSVG